MYVHNIIIKCIENIHYSTLYNTYTNSKYSIRHNIVVNFNKFKVKK